jgi:glutathione peroxidase
MMMTQTRLRARAQPPRVRSCSPESYMPTAYDVAFPKLGGGEINLAEFKGKPVLVVNVASACGLTPQYRDLEALWKAKREAGLIVLGVPCNDFGAQEPGSDSEIAAFCDTQYKVTFPLTGKVEILSKDRRHPFYAWVVDQIGEENLPRWNFHKYLIGRDGILAASIGSKEPPLGVNVLGAVEKALSA